MKHDMTQPIVDLNYQCRRCGTKISALQIVQTGVKPEEAECPGFSAKHWLWRKTQNLKHVWFALMGIATVAPKVGFRAYVKWIFTTPWGWY